MPIFKYFAVAGSALLVFLFVFDAYYGDDQSNSRFNGSLYESAIYAPRPEETVVTAELQFTRDVTPVDRVKEVFAQFVPNENKRGRRYFPVKPGILRQSGGDVRKVSVSAAPSTRS